MLFRCGLRYIPYKLILIDQVHTPFLTIIGLTNISFTVKLKDIKTFEELNDLSINVYGLEKVSDEIEVVGPLHTKRKRTC